MDRTSAKVITIRRLLFTIVLIIATMVAGCKNEIAETEIISDLEIFVRSQNLPRHQSIIELLRIPGQEIVVFYIKYGEPQDCPAGCGFSTAHGLKHFNKIGWTSVEDYDNIDLTALKYYNIDSTDIFLFSEDFFNNLEMSAPWVYHYSFLIMLARDIDTPHSVLLRIAQGLYSYIHPYLALNLLNNLNVQTNKEILTILANLPVFQGDAYSDARERARQLLNNLKPPKS